MNHCNLVHKPILVPRGLNNTGCKGRRRQGVGQIKELASMARIQRKKQEGSY